MIAEFGRISNRLDLSSQKQFMKTVNTWLNFGFGKLFRKINFALHLRNSVIYRFQ